MTDILRVEDIERSFGPVTVLDGVSLTLDAGTLGALIGPNGSGKTTLLRVLAGILPPTGGTRTYTGPAVSREIGYLPQQPTFRPSFTARETLTFYATLVEDDPDTALSRVGLGDAGERRVETLSGGMTRLLGLAQATIGDPPVVILDEPASGLDPQMRRRTFAVARELADDGAAVLLSSHDLALVEERSDQIFVLDGGRLADSGTPSALCERHDAPHLRAVFEEAVAAPDEQVSVIGVSE